MCKFNVGDIVECIHPTGSTLRGGAGHQLGYTFRISSISPSSRGPRILWGGVGGGGVYENCVRLKPPFSSYSDILTPEEQLIIKRLNPTL